MNSSPSSFPDCERLWQILLKRDFGIDIAIHKEPGWNQVINVQFPSPRATPIFGVDPASKTDFLLTIESGAFDVWKFWLKADGRVVGQGKPNLRKWDSPFIHAPYFLRAARFWQDMLTWCDAQESDVGKQIRNSLGTAFQSYSRTIEYMSRGDAIPKTSCRMAVLAVYAFTSGQGKWFRSQTPFDGLFGGYHAYGYYSCLNLQEPHVVVGYFDHDEDDEPSQEHLPFAKDFLGTDQGLGKSVAIDLATGKLMADKDRICFSSPTDNPHDEASTEPPSQDDFLRYLEEYSWRLTTGQYRVDKMGSDPRDHDGITLFPQMPTSRGEVKPISSPVSTIPVVSRTVTRGIEIIGSAIYVREGRDQFGFVYCIRVRLLTLGEDGYENELERGFATCQLQSRHWKITDDSTGRTDNVDGAGVIGLYPLLREGEYASGGAYNQFTKGSFQYQSCTGRAFRTGSFEGEIAFIPGNLQNPTGPPFMAILRPFLLDSKPNFLY